MLVTSHLSNQPQKIFYRFLTITCAPNIKKVPIPVVVK